MGKVFRERSLSLFTIVTLCIGCSTLLMPYAENPNEAVEGRVLPLSVANERSAGTLVVWPWRHPYAMPGDEKEIQEFTGYGPFVEVVGGWNHYLMLAKDGTVWALGSNSAGQLGYPSRRKTLDGSIGIADHPVPVHGLDNVVAIGASYEISVALRSDGTVWAWGGIPGMETSKPVRIDELDGAVRIAAGRFKVVALKASGEVWEKGSWGLIGEANELPTEVVRRASGVRAISGDERSFAAVTSEGRVIYWGDHPFHGSLFLEQYTFCEPGYVNGIDDAVDVAVEQQSMLVVKKDGGVIAWGRNDGGQLADGTMRPMKHPEVVSGLRDISSLEIRVHGIALDRYGVAWQWGGTVPEGATIVNSRARGVTKVDLGGNKILDVAAIGWWGGWAAIVGPPVTAIPAVPAQRLPHEGRTE